MEKSAEKVRLQEYRTRKSNWKSWGPYLSERAWGSLREDDGRTGSPWDAFPFDHASSRAYRWNEDGLAGFCDREQYLCFSFALWNGKDRILKERLFGLSSPEGNHAEDVKEVYFYVDSTPTHSYAKMVYKYPNREFPYQQLRDEARRRSRKDSEFEIIDTGIFANENYVDYAFEYAKNEQNDIIAKVTLTNRSSEEADYTLIPQIWFRNTWSWGYPKGPMNNIEWQPTLTLKEKTETTATIEVNHNILGKYWFYLAHPDEVLFTENNTNHQKLGLGGNSSPYTKDAFQRYVIDKEAGAVNRENKGTKCGGIYRGILKSGEKKEYYVRLVNKEIAHPFAETHDIVQKRKDECDAFYNEIQEETLSQEEKAIQRGAFAGLMWNKQIYYFDVEQWLNNDPGSHSHRRQEFVQKNSAWTNLVSFDILSMPDKWEFPWFATWDLAFHCVPIALIDADFAKRQLTLLLREWFMHPNGQLPAFEWNFSDVNPPVHPWAVFRVYKIDAKESGVHDREFLEGAFHKLLLNFTWWVNRKDSEGNNIFQGGFLGLDNISVFNRSGDLPTGGRIDQSDTTSWMGFYCVTMMQMALELAKENPVYQDTATKFLEHFLRIAAAMNDKGRKGYSLWDDEEKFFFDVLHFPDGGIHPLKVHSLVGLLPILAVATIEESVLDSMPIFKSRLEWFTEKYSDKSLNISGMFRKGMENRRIMAFLTKERLVHVLEKMLSEEEFLSPYGIRSLSKYHEKNPLKMNVRGTDFSIEYEPAETSSFMFGGNSNWRGPVWFPLNFLLIESLQKFHHYWGDEIQVEFPTGSGKKLNLWDVSIELSKRITSLFKRDAQGARPVFKDHPLMDKHENWKEYYMFNEYFHGETGKGLGASQQTGWTGLIAKLIQQSGGKTHPYNPKHPH